MKRAVLAFAAFLSVAGAQSNPEQLANRIVNQSAKIKPGQVVVVNGGKHQLALMEALAMEAQKAGAMVTMFVTSDKIVRTRLAEAPEQYLDQQPKYFAEWLKQVDVWLSVPSIENPKAVFADIPDQRLAKNAKAGQVVDEMLNSARLRGVFVSNPSPEQARGLNVDIEKLQTMNWAAVSANPEQMMQKGNQLKDSLSAAKVRIISSAGTDLTFNVGNRPIFVDAGVATDEQAKAKFIMGRTVSLPAGLVQVAPVETSANGKVVIPRMLCRFEPVVNLKFDVKNGKIENLAADSGSKCLQDSLAAYTGPKDVFGYFSVGVNPELRVMENPGDYRPSRAAGMLYIGFGDNRLFGGSNQTQGGMNFPLVDASLEVNGRAVVKEGKLAM